MSRLSRKELLAGLGGAAVAAVAQRPAWSQPFAAPPAVQALLSIDDGPDGGYGDMSRLILFQLSRASVAADLFGKLSTDPFADVRTYAASVQPNWPAPDGFWDALVTSLVCAAVSQITQRGLDAIANGDVARATAHTLATQSSFEATQALYSAWFANTRKDAQGVPLLTYLGNTSLVDQAVTVVTSDAYLAALELRAVTDPAGARKEAALFMYKLAICAWRFHQPDRRTGVQRVWEARNPSSPEYLAIVQDSLWPSPARDFFSPFVAENPLVGVVQQLAALQTQTINQAPGCMTVITTFYANALEAFVQGPGANMNGTGVSFSTGANWNRADVQTRVHPGLGC